MSKRFLSVLCLVCGVAIFSSCEKDDDNDSTQQETQDANKPDSTNTNVPTDTTGSNIASDTTGTAAQGVTVSGKVGNFTYVDLGLPSGTKWATYNVGASKPTEYGDYFAWGETTPKESYDYTNYKFSKDTSNTFQTFTRYVTSSTRGTVDSLTTLLAEDDAATANWGTGWRMPTTTEQQELLEGCDWEWTDDFNGSGVAGRKGTSKANGNIIFLPAAGNRTHMYLYNEGYYGFYWSSLLAFESNFGYSLKFNNGNVNRQEFHRYEGHSVRAVVK